ncbi:deoxyadenosine/deoxycytidine kinase [Spiroplasma sabaudiense Ar-1343]|uniref:Deoxyadenosine/deoxycytidine kinase n=1 Tax=Spiroplasma sabaudiense Ar-1343 TaxID=1276257 RepID=W6AIW2_9MOLU|nr:deoxynucleoside kinase [Spiroplasma sabaudiense]AHI53649.1 deoxyadenosine/deoxycytidine kinase [Spiroplasma sabaudiense Ar-1343]
MRIALFGTVGAGKSTVSEYISKKIGHEIFPEPIDNNPYFEAYYEDIKNNVFKMQIFMLAARSKQLKQAQQLKKIIFDRTILEDPIFMQVNHDLGNVNDVDFKTYNDFYENVVLQTLSIPDERVKFDIIIYLKVSTDKAIERIKTRGRDSEGLMDRDYWDALNRRYNDFYQLHKDTFPFFVVDAETDDIEAKMEIIMNEIYKKDPSLKP